MSELFPQAVLCSSSANFPASSAPDQRRLMVDTRPFTAGVYNNQMAQGSFPAYKIQHSFFFNGTNWDISQSATNATYTFSVPSGTFLVYGVILEMVTSRNAVLNGNCFGGQYLGGVLGTTTLVPSALANGLVLKCVSGGVTTTLATLNVNEDLGLGQYPMAGGSLTGGVYTFRARYEMRQPLISGTTDALTWNVQDNMTGRGISELRAIAYGAVV